MLWNLDGKIRQSFSNSILSNLSAFLWEIETLLLPKKNFLLKFVSHKYKMRNKGSEIPLFPKKIANIVIDCNWTQNHLFRKRKLNHLAKL